MPKPSLFTPCCFLELSSRDPRPKGFYKELKAAYGTGYDFTPEDDAAGAAANHNEATAFARAMAIARARNSLERAGNQARGTTALDLLLLKARDWGVIPTATDTIASVQKKIGAKKLLLRGARLEAMLDGLSGILGANFIAYRPIATNEATVYPTWPSATARLKAHPTLPAPSRKMCALVDPVGVTGSPLSVTYTNLDPRAAEVDLAAGDVVMVQPESSALSEKVTVASATKAATWTASTAFALGVYVLPPTATGYYYECVTAGTSAATTPTFPTVIGDVVADGSAIFECMGLLPSPRSFTATFVYGHDVGATVTTMDWPYWWSTQHLVFVVVSSTAAIDSESRRQVNEFMARATRGVGLWAIVQPTIPGSPGVLGPYSLTDSAIGTVPLGTFDYVPASAVLSSGPAAPTVTAVTPEFGSSAGGTAVTIRGTGFSGGGLTGAGIGGTALTGLTVVNDTTVTATTAAHAAANSDVVVTGPGGSATLSAGFTYMPASGWTLALTGDLGITRSGSNVTAWADQSGAGNNFTAATAPTFAGGSRGAVVFDGATTSLVSANALTDFIDAGGAAYSLYVVALPTSVDSSANPEAFDAFLSDHDPALVNFGFLCFGPGTGFAGLTNSIAGNIYIGTDSTVGAGNGSIDLSNIQLSVFSLDPAVGGGTQATSVNSGGTFSTSLTGVGTIATSWQPNLAQIGVTDFGAGTYLHGKIFALFCWNRKLTSGEDAIVRTFFKNLYAIPSW